MDWKDGIQDFTESFKSLKSQKLARRNEVQEEYVSSKNGDVKAHGSKLRIETKGGVSEFIVQII